jgi:cyclic pyranopterin phosphate synthase
MPPKHSTRARLTHVTPKGQARMVSVEHKPITARRAVAEGFVRISAALARAIAENTLAKGDLLQVARIAGIQAAKRTDELIPLCHSLPLERIDVIARLQGPRVCLRAQVTASAKTGVEMEALTAVAVAALTVIDMGKAIDPGMVIEDIRLLDKTGGTHGEYHAAPSPRRG